MGESPPSAQATLPIVFLQEWEGYHQNGNGSRVHYFLAPYFQINP